MLSIRKASYMLAVTIGPNQFVGDMELRGTANVLDYEIKNILDLDFWIERKVELNTTKFPVSIPSLPFCCICFVTYISKYHL